MNTFPIIDVGVKSNFTIKNDLKTKICPNGDPTSHSTWVNNKKLFHIVYPYIKLAKYTELLDFYNSNSSLPFYFTFQDYENKQYICVFVQQPEVSYITDGKFKIKVELEEI